MGILTDRFAEGQVWIPISQIIHSEPDLIDMTQRQKVKVTVSQRFAIYAGLHEPD
jgi:hypothetical protein